jgi:S-formylglutathione hydrolase FrmB
MDMRRRHAKPKHGTVVSVKIGDDASGFRHRAELVYLPPAWFASDPSPELPVVVMVGGEFGHPTDWPNAGGAQRTADEFAAAHDGNAPVLVFADTSGAFSNDTGCVNGVRGNAADHLTKDVVPYVISHFGVSPEPAHWGMVGWSSRGTNAGSREQTVARLFGGDAAAFAAFDPATVMTAHGPYSGVAGWFAVAGAGQTVYHAAGSATPPDHYPYDVDPADTAAFANYLCSLASSNGIECAVAPRDGGHDFGTAAAVFSAALPWLAAASERRRRPPSHCPALRAFRDAVGCHGVTCCSPRRTAITAATHG